MNIRTDSPTVQSHKLFLDLALKERAKVDVATHSGISFYVTFASHIKYSATTTVTKKVTFIPKETSLKCKELK